ACSLMEDPCRRVMKDRWVLFKVTLGEVLPKVEGDFGGVVRGRMFVVPLGDVTPQRLQLASCSCEEFVDFCLVRVLGVYGECVGASAKAFTMLGFSVLELCGDGCGDGAKVITDRGFPALLSTYRNVEAFSGKLSLCLGELSFINETGQRLCEDLRRDVQLPLKLLTSVCPACGH